MRIHLRALLYMVFIASLTGCGFQLRGVSNMAFNTMFIQGNTLIISKDLKKSLAVNEIKILNTAENAELLLEMVGEESEKRILSLSGRGLVTEFELYYRVHYRAKFADDAVWGQVQTVEARRDFSYSDANLLAKQVEEKRLNENMQSDVVNSLVRRLSALKK